MRIKIIDTERCVGCQSCMFACSRRHNEAGLSKTCIMVRSVGGMERGFTVIVCRACEDPPCARVCPTKALEVRKGGGVRLDESKCIGCLMCIISCPFGAIDLDTINQVVVKCTGCYELRESGLRPACEAMCPAEAIYFGVPDEIFDKIRRKLAEKMAFDHSREK